VNVVASGHVSIHGLYDREKLDLLFDHEHSCREHRHACNEVP